jgi:LEA14-like dessication related protein
MEILMNTATSRVIEALESGQELTAKQIAARYKVSNPHNVIHTLRNQGYAIYLNSRTNSKGETTKKYRLGTPSRSMLAAWKQRGLA